MLAEIAEALRQLLTGVRVEISEGNHVWQTHMIEFLAIGTALLPLDQEIAPERIVDPIMGAVGERLSPIDQADSDLRIV